MVPPFLAYYGLTTNNQSMLQEAYTQVWCMGFPRLQMASDETEMRDLE